MTTNRDLVEKMVACFGEMDTDTLGTLLHEGAKHTAPGSDFGADLEGRTAIVEYFKNDVLPAFHSVRFEPVNIYEDAASDVVVVEWRSHLEPKTGKSYSNNGVFVIQIKDGSIFWVREYFDTEKANQNVN